jgi:branched-chain amino acid transport system permease protein
MSAAYWRRAMNAGAAGVQVQPPAPPPALRGPWAATHPGQRGWASRWAAAVHWRHVIVLAAALVYPLVATPFFTFQIGGQALALGLIALSLTFLAGYGGMVSLAQMTIAGMAGYLVAIFGTSVQQQISLGWPWWLVVILAIFIPTLMAAFIGWLSVRTSGIYTIMITLAFGVAFYYFCLQNYTIFNGFQGFHEVLPPALFGVDWREPIPYYYLALFWSLAGYFFVKYLLRTPFGLALQGVRDNERRMNALGYGVTAHRVAAYAVAGVLASIGGILLVWYNALIAPGSVGTGALLTILIIAVLGGMRHPIGPFLGAIVFVLLQNFAIDLLGTDYRERFNTVIGLVFLLIVAFSPDGLLGWWTLVRGRLRARPGKVG